MKYKISCAILFIVLLTLGCATMNLDLRNLSPKDLVTVAMDTYTSQFNYHKAKSNLSDLTDRERRDLQSLKKKLIDIHPIIKAANVAVGSDQPISLEDRQQLILFVEEFLY
jgi:hypothetical protein